MKRVKHIDLSNLKTIDKATRKVLENHKKRRRLWRRLAQDGKTIQQNIQEHADRWSEVTGKVITYEMAKRQLFRTIRQPDEREQLWEIIAHDENKTTEQNIAQYNNWVKLQIENRTWRPDPYREFWINDGIRKKRRKNCSNNNYKPDISLDADINYIAYYYARNGGAHMREHSKARCTLWEKVHSAMDAG